MIVPDANILLYAVDEQSPRHSAAKAWIEEQLSGTESVGLSWQVLLAFLRLSTRASVFERPLTVQQAFDLVDGWLAQPPVVILHPAARHHLLMQELLEPIGSAGNLIPDSHLAALAVENGARLASSDRDFGRFARVQWFDPFEGPGHAR